MQVSAKNGVSLAGRRAVVGYAAAQTSPSGDDGQQNNPFMPKMPKRNSNKGTAPEPKNK